MYPTEQASLKRIATGQIFDKILEFFKTSIKNIQFIIWKTTLNDA